MNPRFRKELGVLCLCRVYMPRHERLTRSAIEILTDSEPKVRTRAKLIGFETVTATQPCEARTGREVLEYPARDTNELGGPQRLNTRIPG
jgi:hypothetical protein